MGRSIRGLGAGVAWTAPGVVSKAVKLIGLFRESETSLPTAPVTLETSLPAELVSDFGGFEVDDRAERGVSSSLGVPAEAHSLGTEK